MKLLYITLACILLLSCNEDTTPKYQVLQGNAFGTTYAIQYFSSEIFDAQKGVDSVINAVNKSVSTYIPTSDISRINQGDSTVVVDAVFKEVMRISDIVYTNSKGYFDPTVGALRNAYGFGTDTPLSQISGERLDSLKNLVGFRKVRVNADGTIYKENPNIYFDFNAVAKGYGIDCLGNFLEANNITNYIIELGGEVLSKGQNISKNKSWTAGVESTTSQIEDRIATVVIAIEDKGMAGSGNYRKFRVDETTGKKFVHTINPLTGLAEQSDVTSATVIAPTCAMADAYATACMAMGFERAKKMLSETEDVEAYLTYQDASNISQIFITEGFKKMILN
ncbi:FAD:protein FMN transferase [Patiriisocius marinistellae]|uniref:FAD:protein FMN transferase n=1 Tax=Patiriisocius marinistellae TaxID=2494560 RepID=A0A5J4G2U5_9FLAO|nr:FAD:protein FMN transferase [Patiriisocius marinistellae]GEQ87086.1 FAD:protein FMN transferase [Patiriisocius marinistellae]